MASQTKENYLKALYFLGRKSPDISVKDIAEHLDVRMPSANHMIKKLADEGWIKYEKYKPIRMTETGVRKAGLIIRKHRLTEMYLVEKMGLGWEEVHDIAEQIEHVKSDRFFERMDEVLGNPSHDPHGSPIPDKEGVIEHDDYVPLSEFTSGSVVEVKALNHATDDFLLYLNELSISLGTQIKIMGQQSFDASMTVSYGRKKNINLSKKVCDRLMVETI